MTRINLLNHRKLTGWDRLMIQARRPSTELRAAVRAMHEEFGVKFCTYTTCSHKAARVWKRTREELLVLSAKRQYRALVNATLAGRAYKPKKLAKGVTAVPEFYACSAHVPVWNADRFESYGVAA